MYLIAFDEDPEERRNKKSKASKRTNKQRGGKVDDARKFLDDVAEEESDGDVELRDAEAVRYDAKDLERQNRFDLNQFEQRIHA